MFDAASQPDVEIDLIIWLNLRIRMTAMPKTFKIGDHVRWNSGPVGLVESSSRR